MGRKKTWRQKHDGHQRPAFVTAIEKRFCGFPPGTRLVVATPLEVSDYFRNVPPGATSTIDKLREQLAKTHGADAACPLTTGIFCRIAAEAAWEDIQNGVPIASIAPFWRVIEPDSKLAKKLTCGPDFIRRQRQAESAG